jgi:hypothetical protein
LWLRLGLWLWLWLWLWLLYLLGGFLVARGYRVS